MSKNLAWYNVRIFLSGIIMGVSLPLVGGPDQ
jgi:hypothetical protein